GETAALEDRTHECEERDRKQQRTLLFRDNGKHLIDEIAEEARLDQAKLHPDEAEQQADGGDRERRRITEQHENYQPRDNQGRQVAADEFHHCSGVSSSYWSR